MSKHNCEKALKKLFERFQVVDVNQLYHALNTTSYVTVFRHLKKVGYLCSYSHAGRYYTLSHIPVFDRFGLWFFNGICFSKFVTLKLTVYHLIEQSSQGMTHNELKALLRVRTQNTIRELVKNHTVSRERIAGVFLYISSDKNKAASQLAKRRQTSAVKTPAHIIGPHMTIEMLLELLRFDDWEPQTISKHLQARGVHITAVQVEEVLTRYNLKKKS